MMRKYIEQRQMVFGDPIAGFLLAHGRSFAIGPTTFEGPRMEQGRCFMNATHFSQSRDDLVVYVEGFVSVYGVPIHHAWTATPDGIVIDPTIDNGDKRIGDYFGVAFAPRYVLQASFKNGVYGLLDLHYNRKTIKALLAGKADFQPTNFFKETV